MLYFTCNKEKEFEMSKNPFDVLASDTNYAVGLNGNDIKCLLIKEFSETLLPSTYIYAFNYNVNKFQKVTYRSALEFIEMYERRSNFCSKDAEYSLEAKKFTAEDGETIVRFTAVLNDVPHVIVGIKEFNNFLAQRLDSFHKHKEMSFFASMKDTKEWFYHVYKHYADCTKAELEAVFESLVSVAQLVEEEVDSRVENGKVC